LASSQIILFFAVAYWESYGLNELADVGDFVTITKKINGGLNGLAERQKYYEVAKGIMAAKSP
jgi:putative chitinase